MAHILMESEPATAGSSYVKLHPGAWEMSIAWHSCRRCFSTTLVGIWVASGVTARSKASMAEGPLLFDTPLAGLGMDFRSHTKDYRRTHTRNC